MQTLAQPPILWQERVVAAFIMAASLRHDLYDALWGAISIRWLWPPN
jgi:hypothetical protein